MSFSVTDTLKEVRLEIARLQKIERQLAEAAGEEAPASGRLSEAGRAKISLAARLHHRQMRLKREPRNAELRAEIAKLKKELKAAK
jgi:hypothetical protein